MDKCILLADVKQNMSIFPGGIGRNGHLNSCNEKLVDGSALREIFYFENNMFSFTVATYFP